MILRNRGLLVVALASVLLAAGQATTASASAAQTVTVAPTNPPLVDNCYPFGVGGGGWTPNMGFIYQNVPAFQLKTGDVIAFDTGAVNEADVQLQIDLAATTTNGGTSPAGSFTTVVTNTQTPANPRGDTTIGDFEMRFTAQAPFTFAGGGLIIRFSHPSASYQTDNTCTHVLVEGNAGDPSGFFVERFYTDTDGLPPYPMSDTGEIGAFQLTIADLPNQPVPTGQRAAALKSCKKRAHKHHWSHKRLKKCKRKANLLPV